MLFISSPLNDNVVEVVVCMEAVFMFYLKLGLFLKEKKKNDVNLGFNPYTEYSVLSHEIVDESMMMLFYDFPRIETVL